VNVLGVEIALLNAESWDLPGMTIKTSVIPVNPDVTRKDNTFTVSYPTPEGHEKKFEY
jgi:hypothetical protein